MELRLHEGAVLEVSIEALTPDGQDVKHRIRKHNPAERLALQGRISVDHSETIEVSWNISRGDDSGAFHGCPNQYFPVFEPHLHQNRYESCAVVEDSVFVTSNAVVHKEIHEIEHVIVVEHRGNTNECV